MEGDQALEVGDDLVEVSEDVLEVGRYGLHYLHGGHHGQIGES